MSRGLRIAAWAVAAMVFAFFLIDTIASLWPVQPGRIEWRYGAGGFLSGSLVTLTFGLLLAVAATTMGRGRTGRKVVGSVMMLGAAALLGVLALFGLDALQLRTQVQQEMLTSFDATTVRAVFKLLVGAAIWVVLGVVALRSPAEHTARIRGGRGRGSAQEEPRGSFV